MTMEAKSSVKENRDDALTVLKHPRCYQIKKKSMKVAEVR